jgi:ATP-binding cassette subfamily B protein
MGSVTDNIIMGNQGDEKKAESAARKANIHERISELKNGYNEDIGDGGETFSGGERQRILIARALVKDSSVIIFDEATAFLDKDNEILIKDSIKNELADKIILTIAHRIETVKAADYVYFLKDGKILGEGTHDELIRNNFEYRKHFGLESA